MALGKIKADTLEHSTAGSLDTQYVVNGSAKAWGNIASGGASINDSFNVSTFTDSGTGDGDANFSLSFSDANFSPSCSTTLASGSYMRNIGITTATSKVDITSGYQTNNNANNGVVASDFPMYFNCHGDLA